MTWQLLNGHFPGTWLRRYQKVSIPDSIGAKDDGGGGDNWNYKTCKAPVKASPPTNQHLSFLHFGCLFCRQTNSVGALMGKVSHSTDGLAHPNLIWGLLTFF